MSDVTFDMSNNEMKIHHSHSEPWKVTLIDTGENTMTGGRLRRVKEYLGKEDFCLMRMVMCLQILRLMVKAND
jgi:glucose-1-phosphate cytidylyltransferase